MKNLLFVFLFLFGFTFLLNGQAPVLGTYPGSGVIAGKNTIVTPATLPASTTARRMCAITGANPSAFSIIASQQQQ
jgi:hypothetical protein